MAATPVDADTAAVENISPLPPDQEPWLSLEGLVVQAPPDSVDPAQADDEKAKNHRGGPDWMLDSAFQRALDAKEAERATLRARARAQAAAGLPSEYGPDGLDPALRVALEGQRQTIARFRELRQEGGVASHSGVPSCLIPVGPPAEGSARPAGAEPSAGLFSTVDGVRVVTGASAAGMDGGSRGLEDPHPVTVVVAGDEDVAGGEDVAGSEDVAGIDAADLRESEVSDEPDPTAMPPADGRAGPVPRLPAAAWGEWARRSVPAHRRAEFGRVGAEVAVTTSEDLWVTEEELREARGRVSAWIAGEPGEDLDGVGRCVRQKQSWG